MTTHTFHRALRWLSVPVATLALATSAYADGGHDAPATKPAPQHDMTAAEHADMTAGDHGMSAEEHAGMGAGEQPAPTPSASAEHGAHGDAAAAGDHGAGAEHGEAQPQRQAEDRPVALVLGGFGLLNGAVLVTAAVLRRRPAAQKRINTLARVRATAGTPTHPSPTKPSKVRS